MLSVDSSMWPYKILPTPSRHVETSLAMCVDHLKKSLIQSSQRKLLGETFGLTCNFGNFLKNAKVIMTQFSD